MWTAEQRARHKVRVAKERKGYSTDVSDQEWKLIEPLLPGAARTGRPRMTPRRPALRIKRSTVQRATSVPSRRSWRHTLSAP